MAESITDFAPTRGRGLFIILGGLLLNLAAIGWLALQTMAQQVPGVFIVYLIASMLVFLPIPIIFYRLISLLRAKYRIDREGLYIQWGLRAEDIPMGEIEWVRQVSDLPYHVETPPLSLPGGVLGTKNHPDLGRIDFIASDTDNLLLVATHRQIFAISPRDAKGFMRTFQRSSELGSIAPISQKTARADFLITAILQDRTARSFLFSGIFLTAVLLILVSFTIPTRQTIPLDFNPASEIMEATPTERLLLLPVLSLLMLTADIALGSYLFRKPQFRMAAYFAFASSLILPISFLILTLFIIVFS